MLIFFIISTLFHVSESGLVLNSYIQHFEPLFYDKNEFAVQHRRAKRDVDQTIQLQFNAHNRLFKVRLKRSDDVFAEGALFENHLGQPVDFDLSNVYTGQLEDDYRSSVSGVVLSNGLFDGSIDTDSEHYYIEPAERYFSDSKDFHTVIYKASDVLHGGEPCASQRLYNNTHSHSSVIYASSHKRSRRQSSMVDFDVRAKYDIRYTKDRWKYKPAEKSKAIDPKKTTCMLYLQADHLFYDLMGSEEACITAMTRHVQRVNSIYRVTDFDGDDVEDNISFMIKRIKVYTSEAVNEASYRYPGNYGVEKFLELFSEEDYDQFCLAYMFTYRDFEGGTLGLAWTGDLKNAGGVCERNGHYRGSLKSLNTGIVTLLNYGKHVPPAVSHVTLAHEIGHNFGSPHDPELDLKCTPSGSDGNYIMFARATSGDKANNNKFSPCSLSSINAVLNAKARGSQGCFVEPQSAICGNGVVEKGEECDCGWDEQCTDKCCWPMKNNAPKSEKPCTLRPGRICSPSQGPCCNEECHLKFGTECREDNGCRAPAYCSGRVPQCPKSINKPNKTICNDEFVCYKGECTGSICVAYGLESCQCLRGPNDPITKSCELCCKLPGDDESCLSSFDWNIPPYDIPDMYSKAGTPCDNYNGYCDVFQRCRAVDPSGPLATLHRLLLSSEGIEALKQWAEDYWYLLMLIFMGFVVLLISIVKIFGRTPPIKLKKITVYHDNTTYSIPPSTNHVIHPTAVRSNMKHKGSKARKQAHNKNMYVNPVTLENMLNTSIEVEQNRHRSNVKRSRSQTVSKKKEQGTRLSRSASTPDRSAVKHEDRTRKKKKSKESKQRSRRRDPSDNKQTKVTAEEKKDSLTSTSTVGAAPILSEVTSTDNLIANCEDINSSPILNNKHTDNNVNVLCNPSKHGAIVDTEKKLFAGRSDSLFIHKPAVKPIVNNGHKFKRRSRSRSEKKS